jgi:hypothetical protein
MPPKRVQVQPATPRRETQKQQSGYLSTAYRELTSPDNASVVRSVLMFGVCTQPPLTPRSFLILFFFWAGVGLGVRVSGLGGLEWEREREVDYTKGGHAILHRKGGKQQGAREIGLRRWGLITLR